MSPSPCLLSTLVSIEASILKSAAEVASSAGRRLSPFQSAESNAWRGYHAFARRDIKAGQRGGRYRLLTFAEALSPELHDEAVAHATIALRRLHRLPESH